MLKRSNTQEDSHFFNFQILKFILMLVLFFSVIPYIHSEPSNDIKKINCPSKIICSRNDDLSSCHHTSEDSPYWDRVWYTSSPHKVVAGEYNFLMVNAPYHASFVAVSDATQDNMLVCHYLNEQKREVLGVIAKSAPNLEAYNDKTTKWNTQQLDRAACGGGLIQDCPVKEAYSLAIFNNFDPAMIVSVHDSRIPIYFYQGEAGYHTIRYEDILPYCYAESLCKLDFSTPSESNIGSVVVDINNAMRIIKIISVESSMANIMQNEPFNSIKIEKSDKLPEQPSININNQTNTELLATANEKVIITIKPRTTETVRFNRMLSACSAFAECTINIGLNSSQPNVGSVTVNMRDNMKIIEVTSRSSSQIIVRQADTSNLIEVSYPNLRY
jgi:hypothetical protein